MQTKAALILFTKNPELGKVKTRLAKTVGDKKALDIYCKLLVHTKNIVQNLPVDKFVFYSETIAENDLWEEANYYKKIQFGSDLGTRMKNAFKELFDLQYNSICIIGSDCYDLNSEIIKDAFDKLLTDDVVIGPTFDGGYYLLGMNKLHNKLFEIKTWSTESVYSETESDLELMSLQYSNLVKLTDIDEEKDLPQIWK
ncbi:MAG: TIGR04282 family arsenosugar biosynthesis glycosyltransferase [Flavobacterium sp.]|nr:TIGR04282 family arsenosugar biosynthesis glycosyltransferase [Flavobacterium sp.]